MNNVTAESLADARVQLHWAAQTLSAAADKMLDRADDDSHSNLAWDSKRGALVGRTESAIDVKEFELSHKGDVLCLNGITLTNAMDWLGERVGQTLGVREYDMPHHPVSEGALFSIEPADLAELAAWFDFGSLAMLAAGPTRVWPHHFDLGFLIPISESSSIGGGFSIGDDHFDRPYFYVNPYGISQPDSLPELVAGQWTEKWLGAVWQPESNSNANAQDAKQFVTSAIETCRSILGGT